MKLSCFNLYCTVLVICMEDFVNSRQTPFQSLCFCTGRARAARLVLNDGGALFYFYLGSLSFNYLIIYISRALPCTAEGLQVRQILVTSTNTCSNWPQRNVQWMDQPIVLTEEHESESIIKYGVFHTTLMRRHVHVTPACIYRLGGGNARRSYKYVQPPRA